MMLRVRRVPARLVKVARHETGGGGGSDRRGYVHAMLLGIILA